MAESFRDRLSHAWSAFTESNRNSYELATSVVNYGPGYSLRPDRLRYSPVSERSIVAGVYTRIAMDITSANIRHVKVDNNGRYLSEITSGLNECLSVEANIDQTGTALLHDIVMSLFDEGVVAIVPVETTEDPKISGSYDVKQLRTGQVLEWFPRHVKLRVYNDSTGRKEEITLPKESVAIVENPLYSVMNEPDSILKRLLRKLTLLDQNDEAAGAGKLDLIIQLPYVVKSDARKEQAERRRKEIEFQLTNSKYGIAYTDGTEKVTQLNRPIENDLLNQIKYLNQQLYERLGLTTDIISGVANEAAMKNYYSRTVDPILKAITEAMKRRFLTKTARTKGHSILYYRDPFQLVPVGSLASMADAFSRNAILTANEIRAIMGYKPSESPGANDLSNKNMPVEQQPGGGPPVDTYAQPDEQLGETGFDPSAS